MRQNQSKNEKRESRRKKKRTRTAAQSRGTVDVFLAAASQEPLGAGSDSAEVIVAVRMFPLRVCVCVCARVCSWRVSGDVQEELVNRKPNSASPAKTVTANGLGDVADDAGASSSTWAQRGSFAGPGSFGQSVSETAR